MIVDAQHAPLTPAVVRVDATQVHKTDARELLLADSVRLPSDRFSIGLRWPVHHSLYQGAADGSGDPVLAVETLRQAAIFLSHQYFEVPLGHQFILVDFDLEITDPLGLPSGQAVSSLRLDCQVSTRSGRARLVGSLTGVFRDGTRVCARGTLRWQALSPASYDALRRRSGGLVDGAPTGGAPTDGGPTEGEAVADRRAEWPALPPSSVGRRHGADVVLLRTGQEHDGSWALWADQGHPVYFDHLVDHVPGMLLFEAVRQGGHAAAWSVCGPTGDGLALVGTTTAFPAFCELGPDPVLLEVTATGRGRRDERGRELLDFAVSARQRGVEVARGTTCWACTPVPSTAASAAGDAATSLVPGPAHSRGGRRSKGALLCR